MQHGANFNCENTNANSDTLTIYFLSISKVGLTYTYILIVFYYFIVNQQNICKM